MICTLYRDALQPLALLVKSETGLLSLVLLNEIIANPGQGFTSNEDIFLKTSLVSSSEADGKAEPFYLWPHPLKQRRNRKRLRQRCLCRSTAVDGLCAGPTQPRLPAQAGGNPQGCPGTDRQQLCV